MELSAAPLNPGIWNAQFVTTREQLARDSTFTFCCSNALHNTDAQRWSISSSKSSTASLVLRESQDLYLTWSTVRIQAWWRRMLCRTGFLRLRRAAQVIQAAWRSYSQFSTGKRKDHNLRKAIIPPVYLAVTKKTYEMIPIIKIQQLWRNWVGKTTFKEIQKVIHSYEKTDPRTMLLQINRREAMLADSATGLHVRFRLSGLSFPPMILYKVYTHRPVVDMGSFSPRQYAEGPEKSIITYVRWENNGWRPVIGSPVEQTGPRAVLQVQDLLGFFSNSPEERRILKLLALKKRKRAWLRKLYTEGRAAEYKETTTGIPALESIRAMTGAQSELPDLELMRWSAGLDFEEYDRDWYMRATRLPDVYDHDWHKLGTCLPLYDVPVHTIPVVQTPTIFY